MYYSKFHTPISSQIQYMSMSKKLLSMLKSKIFCPFKNQHVLWCPAGFLHFSITMNGLQSRYSLINYLRYHNIITLQYDCHIGSEIILICSVVRLIIKFFIKQITLFL